MTTIQKKQILSQINTLNLNDLISLIDDGDITLDEMITEGLSSDKIEDIRTHFKSKQQITVNQSEMISLCNQIEKGDLNVEKIKNLLISDKLTEADLLKYTSLNQDLIYKIQNHQSRYRHQQFYSLVSMKPVYPNIHLRDVQRKIYTNQ